MANGKKVYNINAMRPALVKAREDGNRRVITKSMCSELGISDTYYEWYKKGIESLFNAVCSYCRLKNSPKASAESVNTAHEAIYPLWKDLLSTAERDKMTRELRVTEHDISNLVSFCQTFVNDANDASRGQDETFVAHKVWATQPLKQFQKKVETDLGIRIAQVEVLSDAERDFLSAERKILNQWKKAERRIGELAAQKERLIAMKTKLKGAEAKALLEEQIADIDAQTAQLSDKIENLQQKHKDLLNPPAEDKKEEVPTPKAAAMTKRSRRKKKAEAADGDTIVAKRPADKAEDAA